MLILSVLFLQLFFMLRSANFNRGLVIATFIFLVWNVGFMTILHLELLTTGSSTYGSDESLYFHTMTFANGLDNWFVYLKQDFNFTYVLYGTLILKTSWFESIYLIRLCNVMLLINTAVLFYLFAKKFLNINSSNIYYALYFVGLNGMITWTAMRNIKDMLFIYALMIVLYYLFDFLKNRKWSIFRVGMMFAMVYVLLDIRQWFLYLLLLILVLIFAVRLFKRKRYFTLSVAIGILTYLLSNVFQNGLNVLLMYTNTYSDFSDGGQLSSFTTGSLLSLPMSMGRFILGPGPIRGLFGSDSFLTFTNTGNFLITVGSLAWWFVLPVFILACMSIKNFKQNYVLFIIIVFYWMMYSYAYAGSGDTRLRAVLYILCALYTLPFLEHIKTRYFNLKYVSLAIPIILIGSYFSYFSLN